MYPAASSAAFRLPSYPFTHRTVGEMYEKIIRAGVQIGQLPITISISTFSRREEEFKYDSHKLDYSSEQHDFINNFIHENCEIIDYFNIDFRCYLSNLHGFKFDQDHRMCPSFYDYFVSFTKDYNNPAGTIEMNLKGTQINGFLMNEIAEEAWSKDVVFSLYQKTFDDIYQHSFYIYRVIKEWMNALEAEECWGQGRDETLMSSDYYMTNCFGAFRFTRSGPQLVDMSMETQKLYTDSEVDVLFAKEFPDLFALKQDWKNGHIISYFDAWRRVIDLPWDDYYETLKNEQMPPLQAAYSPKLYDLGDHSYFPHVAKCRKRYIELRKDVESGKYNFDDGFMTP